ncbi:MAG: ABC transporter substrate-binding protein [Candidatus Pacearchaeota archaeon]|jgi:branched-chain amino acid transport system substrate-binding protein
MKTKKKVLIIIVVALIVIIVSAGFLIKNGTIGKPVLGKETIKIGFTTALSGNYAYIGEDVLRGVKEAIDESNNKEVLNRKIELLIEDNQADPKTAVTSYQLLKSEGVNVVFSSFSTITEALSPLANQDKTILMYEALPTTYAEKYNYTFKVYSNANQEAEAITNAVKKSNDKTAFVYVNNPATIALRQIFVQKMGNMEEYKFEVNDDDFRTIILKLKSNNVENVILNGYPKQILAFIKQSVELDYNVKKIFVTSDGGSKDVVDNVESSLNNSKIEYILVGYGPQSKEIYYVFSYDSAKVLIEGMKSCQNLGKRADDPECLKIELQKVKINGKSGFVDMNNSRIAQMSPQLYTVKNKELVPYAI